MKKFILIQFFIGFSGIILAQVPNKLSYQAVIRNSSGILRNSNVGIRIQILQYSESGAAVYVETHAATTNDNGLATIEIGGGTIITGNFTDIDWSAGPVFLKTETDPTGGTDYTITGTNQILSVPYALYAKTAENGFSGNYIDLTNKPSQISEFTLDADGQNITNLADPANKQDAATKAYVDALKDIIYSELLDAGLNAFVKDVDGKAYKTIKIGSQVWMAENLSSTTLNDSTPIPQVTDNTAWTSLSTPAYCWFANDSATYGETYGALYNWYTVNTGKLCPTGWHVPIEPEWKILTDYLGGESFAAGKLKETGTIHWESPNTGATNEYGYTALPGGYRFINGLFYDIGAFGNLWSSTEANISSAWYLVLSFGDYNTKSEDHDKNYGFSVRCLRD